MALLTASLSHCCNDDVMMRDCWDDEHTWCSRKKMDLRQRATNIKVDNVSELLKTALERFYSASTSFKSTDVSEHSEHEFIHQNQYY